MGEQREWSRSGGGGGRWQSVEPRKQEEERAVKAAPRGVRGATSDYQLLDRVERERGRGRVEEGRSRGGCRVLRCHEYVKLLTLLENHTPARDIVDFNVRAWSVIIT